METQSNLFEMSRYARHDNVCAESSLRCLAMLNVTMFALRLL